MLARMIERQPGVWPDNVLGKWGSKNFRKREMEDVLMNDVYGFSTTNPLPKAVANTGDTGKSFKMRGKHVVGLQKELDVQQAIKDGTVKPSALADELKLRGVSIAILTPGGHSVRICDRYVEWVSPGTQLSSGITPGKAEQKQKDDLYLRTNG
jgi:hypothetical protein